MSGDLYFLMQILLARQKCDKEMHYISILIIRKCDYFSIFKQALINCFDEYIDCLRKKLQEDIPPKVFLGFS